MIPRDKNSRVVLMLIACVVVMAGMAYASVPLYSMFCRATGFGGTTQRVTEARTHPSRQRSVTVSFDGNVDPALPWDFASEVKSVRVKLGEVTTIKYRATNRGSRRIVGTATYNVQPDKSGLYFDKIQCFCFTDQVLNPGESVELPVQFFVDTAMADDKQDDDVQNITLSYTFFAAKDQSKAQAVKQVHVNPELNSSQLPVTIANP